MKRKLASLFVHCFLWAVGFSRAEIMCGDTFSWGAGTVRTNCSAGTSINGLVPECGSDTAWKVVAGSGVFGGSSGYPNGTLVMDGGNTSVTLTNLPALSGALAIAAEGVFTPENSSGKFLVGLQANAPDHVFFLAQTNNTIFARVDADGTVFFVSVVDGVSTSVTDTIIFTSGDIVSLVLTLQMAERAATLTVTGSDLMNRTELTLSWTGSPQWEALAINKTESDNAGSLELSEIALYELPTMPSEFPKNMIFRPLERLNPSKTFETTDELSNYPICHALVAGTVKAQCPDTTAIQIVNGWHISTKETNAGTNWPGYLMYDQGTKITNDLSANAAATTIYVEDPACFSTSTDPNVGGNQIIIYALASTSPLVPNWDYYENAVVTNVNPAEGYIQVERAQFGTTRHAFTNGQAVAAPHACVYTGPTNKEQWWLPNFSLEAPTNPATGMQAWEFFSQRVATEFLTPDTNGIVPDGMEHDLFYSNRNNADRPLDCNNDLIPDWGYMDGVNSFCLGLQKYMQNLRYLVGPDKIIQVDNDDAEFGYRGWGYLNGVQIETFMGFDRFSEAMEHVSHWTSSAEALPRFSYGYTRFKTETYGGVTNDDWRFRVHFASGLINGIPHPYGSFYETNGYDNPWMGAFEWDEQNGGTFSNWCWLGEATGSAVRDTSGLSTNWLTGDGDGDWRVRTKIGYGATSSGSLFDSQGLCVVVTNTPAETHDNAGVYLQRKNSFTLTTSNEYTVIFTAKGDDRWVVNGEEFDNVPRLVQSVPHCARRMSVLADRNWRTYTHTFTVWDISDVCSLDFTFGDTVGTNWIKDIQLKEGSADRWWRDFENGRVYLNMSKTSWTNTVGTNTYYWKLLGDVTPDANNGSCVNTDGIIVVPPKDALFLSKTDPNTVRLSQTFSGSTNLADYTSSTPGTNKFNSITAGAGDAFSITGGTLQLSKGAAVASTINRITPLDAAPMTLFKFQFDIGFAFTNQAANTSLGYFEHYNSGPTTVWGTFGFQVNADGADNAWRVTGGLGGFTGVQTVTVYVNDTGSDKTYIDPLGTQRTITNTYIDIWVGNTLAKSTVATGLNTANDINGFRYVSPANGITSGTLALDNFRIERMP